jgi:hypothetical protein
MVLNRIEQKEREAAEQRRNAELQRQKNELAQRQAEDKKRQKQRQEQMRQLNEAHRLAEARRQLVRTNSNYVFNSSGALQGLKDIKDGKLTNTVRKYALVIDLDTGTAELAWGNKFTVKNNQICNSLRFFSSLKEADYQSIKIIVNPDTLDLSIQGNVSSTLMLNEWKNNSGRVLDALADAYLNPNRVTYREEPPSSSSGSSSGSPYYQAEC